MCNKNWRDHFTDLLSLIFSSVSLIQKSGSETPNSDSRSLESDLCLSLDFWSLD